MYPLSRLRLPKLWNLRYCRLLSLGQAGSTGDEISGGSEVMADRGQFRTSNRGFASMDEKRQGEIASKGGQASGGNFKNDRRRAAEAGRKGGESVPPPQSAAF